MQHTLPEISSVRCASGMLRSIIPELYDLQHVAEVNPWHNKQSVFDHTVATIRCMEQLFAFIFVPATVRHKLECLLDKKIDVVSRRWIILSVALLHDIAKARTLTVDTHTGLTLCKNHESLGRAMSKDILRRWGASEAVISYVSDIVGLHGTIHMAINEVIDKGISNDALLRLQRQTGEKYFDLLLLGYADTAGSDLMKLNPKEFSKREQIYQKELTRFAQSL